ncbi:hypothetical protein [Dyadobacter sp. LHD-138]|uniref:hypothetical protein n=1 Tax=Dyadobacter sp. LHD-138 TaxID=3071413 RepID=UPI0027E057C6|nr:hypothetical protein [Dyadobacter sp. LHD-138]MDQ6481828.1 hypothetical protein [Dyadobacter sp. LHD-138]
MSGFYIKELTVSGGGQQVNLKFEKGANLVTGASDTGKTYVFSVISYALGSSQEPKTIPEAVGYNEVYLTIATFKNPATYILHRVFGKNQIHIRQVNHTDGLDGKPFSVYKKFTTAGKASAENHISGFLLSLCGLNNLLILESKTTGKTVNLTYSYLRKLTFIDESRIITTGSPFYFSDQYIDRTKSQSLLNLLLTGHDASEVKQIEEQKVKETRITGKLEFLSGQVLRFAHEKELTTAEYATSVGKSHEIYLEIDRELRESIELAKALTARKNEVTLVLQNYYEKLSYKTELLNRFKVLEKQYLSDNERLNFILESSILSSQLGDTLCPICSSPLDENHLLHVSEHENFRVAALEEINRNSTKLIGLRASILDLQTEESEIRIGIAGEGAEISQIELELSENLTPKIEHLRSDLRIYLNAERLLNKISFIDEQLSSLYQEKDRLEKQLKLKETAEDGAIVEYSSLLELSAFIETRLSAWNYEQYVKVDFDSRYQTFDIAISGKNRSSYGKGKRSISFAACLLGLMDYSQINEMNSPNLLVLDSPLTTFEEKKQETTQEDDLLSKQVLRSFFIDFAETSDSSQVIIFDNKMPDRATMQLINGKVNMHVFTGSAQGRFGFFPPSSQN